MNSLSQENSSRDRRRHPRLESSIPLKIYSDDFDIVTETKNLSRTGTYCRVKKYIEPMTKLKVHLLLPVKRSDKVATKRVSCQGVIVRTESVPGSENFNIAIYFNDIQNRDADTISDFVGAMMGKVA